MSRIIKLATQVKRRTRDLEVIELCDYIISGSHHAPMPPVDADKVYIGDPIDRKKFDKTEYMRDYMRKRRAEPKDNG